MNQTEIMDILHFGYPLHPLFDHPLDNPFTNPQNNPLDEAKKNCDFGNLSPHHITLAQLKNVFIENCERLLGSSTDVVLPLSGGLDSRLVLACLLELVPPNRIHAFNYGSRGQLDFEIPPLIAKATGVHFTQVSYDRISISANDIIGSDFNIQNTPAHNIVGYTVTQKASQMALQQLGVNGELSVWSGFLGDRVFFGKWSDNNAVLFDACNIFSDFYSINLHPQIALSQYHPATRLRQLYHAATKPNHLTWLEFLDLDQRQYRVRATLQTLDNPYCFLFEQPQVFQSILAFNNTDRKNGKLQRDFFHQFYPQWCQLPVTSRFGYPFRKFAWMEKLDRYYRLFTHKTDALLGSNMERFKRKKVTVNSLAQQIRGYKEALDFGIKNSIHYLSEHHLPINETQQKMMTANRSRYELMASLGYLLK